METNGFDRHRIGGNLMALNIQEPLFDENFSDIAELDGDVVALTNAEARELAEDIRRDLDGIQERIDILRPKIYRFHRGNGYAELGYDNWDKCVKDLFGGSRQRFYQQLDAAKIEAELFPDEPIGTHPERTLREFKPLLKDKERLKEAKDEVVKQTGGKLTAPAVRQAVGRIKRRLMNDRMRYESAVSFFGKMNKQVLLVGGVEGIPAFIKDWSDAEVRYFLRNLARYRDILQSWIDAVGAIGKIDPVDVSYSEGPDE